MKRPQPVVLAFLVLISAVASAAGPPTIDDLMLDMQITPVDPQPAPPLTVETLKGGRVTLADVKGHVVLVYFWATW